MNVANIRIGVVQNDISQEPRIVLSCTGETFMRVDFNLVEFRQLIKREASIPKQTIKIDMEGL